MIDPDRELRWLRRLRDLTHELARETDPRRLVPRILDAAIELAQAERGFLVRVERRARAPDGAAAPATPAPASAAPAGGREPRVKMRVEVARGFDQETLSGAQGKVSRTVVERVLERGRGLVTSSEEDADVRDVSSVQARRVLSILCVPMQLRGEMTGVLYLDHRFDPQVFAEVDLPVALAFADQAALALETAELAHARATPGGAAPVGAQDEGEAPRSAPLAEPLRLGRLVSRSPLMRAAFDEVERAARSTSHVLVPGEGGTGKELVARELHARGDGPPRPFVAVGCAGQPEAALELELFGRRGPGERRGQLALAGAGTLFLDEVGELGPAVQGKLLRVLQEARFRPLGGEQDVPLSCRVVAATRHDLRARVAQGAFREDLFYRLDVLRIALPPLRARPEDVPLLLAQVLEAEAARPVEVTEKALELLAGYSWPGNVRELENEARRLAALGEARVTARHLSPEVAAGRGLARAGGAWSGKTLGEVEKEMVVAALRESGGNKARAARQLGIPKTTLYHLIARYELS